MKTCIVCNISGPNASNYLETYSNSLRHNASVVSNDVSLVYTNGTPKSQPKSIVDRELVEGFSYLSKFYALKDCIEAMHPDYIIWLDASCRIHNGFIEKAKDIMDKHGVLLLQLNSKGGEWWCTDRFMKCIGEDRNTYTQPVLLTGVFGFKPSHPMGQLFYSALNEKAGIPDMWFGTKGIPFIWDVQGTECLSLDPRVKGHRQDQSVIEHITKKLNLDTHNNIEQPIFYSQNYIQEKWLKDPSRSDYYFPSDALVTHHPPETHFTK